MLTDLIEAFKPVKIPHVPFKYPAYFIHQLADPEIARQRCSSASHAFFHFLYESYPRKNADGYQADIGILYLDYGHYANVVQGTVVDWTARQFFPDTPWPLIEPVEVYLRRWGYAELVVRPGHAVAPDPCIICGDTPCPPVGLLTPLSWKAPMLCSMCSPRGVSVDKVCPTCGSCIHICRGANGNPCRPNMPLPDRKTDE